MDVQVPNLLDDALGGGGGRVFLIEDCVETSGAFVLHHFLKRSLSPNSSDAVIFLSFSQPFSHYDRILRKMVHTFSLCVRFTYFLVEWEWRRSKFSGTVFVQKAPSSFLYCPGYRFYCWLYLEDWIY